MIHLDIPGFGERHLRYLVLDYNGTLAIDGILIPGVRERLLKLAGSLEIHVVTANTFGTTGAELHDVPCKVTILSGGPQDLEKSHFVEQLRPNECICIGNGRNDREMLRVAGLGIAVIQSEGASPDSLAAAHVICTDILSALDLLKNPKRLTATLRS